MGRVHWETVGAVVALNRGTLARKMRVIGRKREASVTGALYLLAMSEVRERERVEL